jgi:predicted nucleotidyltransferase
MDRGFDVASAARTLYDREARIHEQRRRLYELASADCARIIEMIVRDFQPSRVIQWGSLLEPESFDENSDIDIAVDGLGGAQKFLDLHGMAFRMTDFPLDIVELERTDPAGRDSIMRRGRVVYERDG